jgi:hypothetical protein
MIIGMSFSICWTTQHTQAKDAPQGTNISRIDNPKEQGHLVGHVKLNILLPLGPHFCKFTNFIETNYSCFWHKLVKLVSNLKVVKF